MRVDRPRHAREQTVRSSGSYLQFFTALEELARQCSIVHSRLRPLDGSDAACKLDGRGEVINKDRDEFYSRACEMNWASSKLRPRN